MIHAYKSILKNIIIVSKNEWSIHWFYQSLLSSHYMQGTVLDAAHTSVYNCRPEKYRQYQKGTEEIPLSY